MQVPLASQVKANCFLAVGLERTREPGQRLHIKGQGLGRFAPARTPHLDKQLQAQTPGHQS